MCKRTVAVFDFDGTITTKDTLLEFIIFACGRWKFIVGFLLHAPWLCLMVLRLYPNWKCKERIFSWFFKGMRYDSFVELGRLFANRTDDMLRQETVGLVNMHLKEGATVYVISASIEEWVRPTCMKLGITDVIGTKIEVNSKGVLTGKFLTPNCYGQEKVRRLLEVEPQRDEFYLCAYGDSRGDKEMLDFADKGRLIVSIR